MLFVSFVLSSTVIISLGSYVVYVSFVLSGTVIT